MFQPHRFHRVGTALSFALAGILLLAGMLATPWENGDTEADYMQTLRDHPEQSQTAALLLHFAYLFFVPALLGGMALARRRWALMSHVGAVAAALGFATLSGFLISDFYALAMAQELDMATAVDTAARLDTYPLLAVMAIPAFAGAILGTIVFAVGVWRNQAVGLWVPITLAGGLVGLNLGIPSLIVMAAGGALVFVATGGLALRIMRTPDSEWGRAPRANQQEVVRLSNDRPVR